MATKFTSTAQNLEIHRALRCERKPKLLFLAYPFPPANINSCVRTSNLAKYLSRLGWDVTVLTPCPSVWRNVENSRHITELFQREGIRRILTAHRWRCLSPTHLNCWNRGMGWSVGGYPA